jgi:NAD(P)-dependent dehydrogenase (short-subunit alcohol dehydrogenase family)
MVDPRLRPRASAGGAARGVLAGADLTTWLSLRMTPAVNSAQPEEVARAIVWLLSDEASFTTGAFLEVTGGR